MDIGLFFEGVAKVMPEYQASSSKKALELLSAMNSFSLVARKKFANAVYHQILELMNEGVPLNHRSARAALRHQHRLNLDRITDRDDYDRVIEKWREYYRNHETEITESILVVLATRSLEISQQVARYLPLVDWGQMGSLGTLSKLLFIKRGHDTTDSVIRKKKWLLRNLEFKRVSVLKDLEVLVRKIRKGITPQESSEIYAAVRALTSVTIADLLWFVNRLPEKGWKVAHDELSLEIRENFEFLSYPRGGKDFDYNAGYWEEVREYVSNLGYFDIHFSRNAGAIPDPIYVKFKYIGHLAVTENFYLLCELLKQVQDSHIQYEGFNSDISDLLSRIPLEGERKEMRFRLTKRFRGLFLPK